MRLRGTLNISSGGLTNGSNAFLLPAAIKSPSVNAIFIFNWSFTNNGPFQVTTGGAVVNATQSTLTSTAGNVDGWSWTSD